MDIITQGLIGAALAQSIAKPKELRLALLIGFGAPLLADLDVLIRSVNDPLLFLEYHRHFSHALLFIPLGALLASLLFWPLCKSKLVFKQIYIYAFAGYATAGILDACTSYGTHLLWPLSDARTSWSIISIFDPVFASILIIALLMATLKRQICWARIGLICAIAYLCLGFMQKQRATSAIYFQANQRGHQIERLTIKPTIGNIILWRSIYETQNMFYVDAVRVGLLAPNHIYEGETAPVFTLAQAKKLVKKSSQTFKDIMRFNHFSNGFLSSHPSRPNSVGDMRYAMLPTSARPLWSINWSNNTPKHHVSFHTDRSISADEHEAFLSMLLGSRAKH